MKNESMVTEYITSIYSPGSINILGDIIDANNIDIDAHGIVGTLLFYIRKLSFPQNDIFRSYFLHQSTIQELRTMFNFTSMEEAKQTLNESITAYMDMLKEDYGIK